jgi:hypothetical protein
MSTLSREWISTPPRIKRLVLYTHPLNVLKTQIYYSCCLVVFVYDGFLMRVFVRAL